MKKNDITYFFLKIHRKLKAIRIPASIRWRIAVHEAGHAYFYMKYIGVETCQAFIDGDGGLTSCRLSDNRIRSPELLWHWLSAVLGGLIAEQVFLGNFERYGALSDLNIVVKTYRDYAHLASNLFGYRASLSNTGGADIIWKGMDLTDKERNVLSAVAVEGMQKMLLDKSKIEDAARLILKETSVNEKDLSVYFQSCS